MIWIQQQGSRVPEGMMKVLGLEVCGEDNTLQQKRENAVSDISNPVMQWNVFSLCGKLTRHFPVYGQLRVTVRFVKQRVNMISCDWNEELTDTSLKTMIQETISRVKQNNPLKQEWYATGQDRDLWVNVSSLVTGRKTEC